MGRGALGWAINKTPENSLMNNLDLALFGLFVSSISHSPLADFLCLGLDFTLLFETSANTSVLSFKYDHICSAVPKSCSKHIFDTFTTHFP